MRERPKMRYATLCRYAAGGLIYAAAAAHLLR